jgi:hypothetical protein
MKQLNSYLYSKDYKIAQHVYQILIQPSESLDLELVFSPTEVSSYDFNLPLFVNQTDTELDNSEVNDLYTNSPQFSEYNRRTPKQSRLSYADYSPKRSVIATGLRHAIELSLSKINFNIPIMYLEKLKDGGFYEAKVNINYKLIKNLSFIIIKFAYIFQSQQYYIIIVIVTLNGVWI